MHRKTTGAQHNNLIDVARFNRTIKVKSIDSLWSAYIILYRNPFASGRVRLQLNLNIDFGTVLMSCAMELKTIKVHTIFFNNKNYCSCNQRSPTLLLHKSASNFNFIYTFLRKRCRINFPQFPYNA